jgi:hypothetical protein
MTIGTIHNGSDTAAVESRESMIAHLERLGAAALRAALEEDLRRDDACAAWLTARFTQSICRPR